MIAQSVKPEAKDEVLALIPEKYRKEANSSTQSLVNALANNKSAIAIRHKKLIFPDWHAPWELMRVISGHVGWVHAIEVDPLNEFFVSGSADRTIKFWDLVTGQLKITLTGHINSVMGLALSKRHPYLFSCGEDKTVKCWDLE